MLMDKYNPELGRYEGYVVPEEWICPLYCEDMAKIVNCAQCGKELRYGETYTSKEVHNHIGLGYGVCEECYQEEWKRKNKYERV